MPSLDKGFPVVLENKKNVKGLRTDGHTDSRSYRQQTKCDQKSSGAFSPDDLNYCLSMSI